ncbi:MAG: CDP-glycerol glycerophosphotransferase family protein [Cetobacterium sp.]
MSRLMDILKKTYRKYAPEKIKNKISEVRNKNRLKEEQILIERQLKINEELEKKLKGKEKIKVAFFVIHNSVWKFDNLYLLMEKNLKFEPLIVICPYMIYGEERMLEDLEKTENVFKKKGYRYINTYDKKDKKWLDIKKELNPEIIFFTNPYETLTKDEYYIKNFEDTLCCYTNYAYNTCSEYEMFYNSLFHNLLWRKFEETPIHLKIAQKYSRIKGRNSVCIGYPGIEPFLKKDKIEDKSWKKTGKKQKKIIWAPHHTLSTDALLNWSTFERYSKFMLELAKKYSENIQFSFKPHPILKSKLEILWGKEKTEEYYKQWENGENTQLEEGSYEELFLTSDAMIHDCGSFSVEYLYTLKPVCRPVNVNKDIDESLNEFGKMVYNLHYKALNEMDIIAFIENVIKNNDPMLKDRIKFYNQYLINEDNELPSQKIIKELEKYIM